MRGHLQDLAPAALRSSRLAAAMMAAGALAGCHRAAPQGQVLATVGGKDVTLQDVRAEGRADGVPEGAGHGADAALLQRVIDRDLLARMAHAQGLDRTPEAPSDLARIQRVWLGDKAAKRLLQGLATPSEVQARAFISAHPYAFAKRERIAARTLTLARSSSVLPQLETFKSFDQAQTFLKRLGVPATVGAGEMDTAQMSPAAAAQLTTTPKGALLITQLPGRLQLVEVQGRAAVVLGAAEQFGLAKRALAAEAASRRIGGELAKLRSKTAIVYQPGYAPVRASAAAGNPL